MIANAYRRLTVGRLRYLTFGVIAYFVIAAVGSLSILGAMGVAKIWGPDVLATGPGEPAIENFRRVDDKVYAGAQPEGRDFQELADLGVTLVVDLRSGDLGDPIVDDPEFLASLGMEYLPMPLTDGHAPTSEMVRAFVAAVGTAEGLVYLHCGGGVGRSGALQGAYLNATGGDFSVSEYLAVGPPTVEQIFYVWQGKPGDPPSRNGVLAAFSRYAVDFPRTVLTWTRGLLS
jgi:protein tyrosine phosphatase (PTP) superfamily phosphohydrolase (DUF442 family)